MKKIYKLFLLPVIALASGSCADSFLDTDNLTGKDNTNFPLTYAEAQEVLTSCYEPLMGQWDEPAGNTDFVATVMSDDCFPGGGSDDRIFHAIGSYKRLDVNMYATFWRRRYEGIYRCNFLLSVADQIEMSADQRNQFLGECHFLRGMYYFDLARAFENVPVVLSPEPANNPQATPDELYAQIGSDFKQACDLLPDHKFDPVWNATNLGRATRWAAEGMLARAWLFYTGFYNKESLPVATEEGTVGAVTKADIIKYVDDCIANSGHELVSDFRNLWAYSYAEGYAYRDQNNLKWVTDDGTNPEAVFVCHHGVWNNPDWGNYGANLAVLDYGLRYQDEGAGYGDEGVWPFAAGWGAGTVTESIYNSFASNDIRRQGSIINVDDPSEGLTYTDNCSGQCYDTHLFIKKYTPINVKSDNEALTGGTGYCAMALVLYPGYTETDFQVNNLVDYMMLRFADILLMGAELGGPNAQQYMDRVRARVGLASVPATLENIKKERRWELAFEGIRYYDVLRWHDEAELTANRSNCKVLNAGVETVISIPFRPETRGFLPIPQQEIEKSGNILKQNQGWTDASCAY